MPGSSIKAKVQQLEKEALQTAQAKGPQHGAPGPPPPARAGGVGWWGRGEEADEAYYAEGHGLSHPPLPRSACRGRALLRLLLVEAQHW